MRWAAHDIFRHHVTALRGGARSAVDTWPADKNTPLLVRTNVMSPRWKWVSSSWLGIKYIYNCAPPPLRRARPSWGRRRRTRRVRVSCPPPAFLMVTQSATILERHLLLGQGPTHQQMPAHKSAAAFAFPGAAGAVAFAAGLAAAAVSGKIKRKRLVKEVRETLFASFFYRKTYFALT